MILAALGAGAFFVGTLIGTDDSSTSGQESVSSPTRRSPSTTVHRPSTTRSASTTRVPTPTSRPPQSPNPRTRSYAITNDVAVRSGPATTFSQIGTVAAGQMVAVECVTPGEVVNGPYGPDSHWDRVAANPAAGYGSGYVTDEYVDTEDDVNDPTLIPPC